MKLKDHIKPVGNDYTMSRAYLTSLISENTLESAVRRRHIEVSERGWYLFSSFPNTWKETILFNLGAESEDEMHTVLMPIIGMVQEEKSQKTLPQLWATYYNAKDVFFFQPIVHDPRRATALAHLAAMFRMLDRLKTHAQVMQATGLKNREEVLNAYLGHFQINKWEFFPNSLSRIKTLFYTFSQLIADDIYNETALKSLISGKYLNENTTKLSDLHEGIFLEYYFKSNKLDVLESFKNYEMVCRLKNMEPVSYSTIKRFTLTDKVLKMAALFRHGSSVSENMFRTLQERESPNYSFSLIAGDGWVPGVSVEHTYYHAKVKKTVTRTSIMSVWVWFDWKTKAILSYRIAPTEDGQQIRNSFRDILALHNDQIPLSVMVDKKWEDNPENKSIWDKLGVEVQPKRAYNPKANIAERTFKDINKVFRKQHATWVNRTPGKSLNNHHNDDHTKGRMFIQLPEFEQLVSNVVAEWNNTPAKGMKVSRIQWCHECINPASKTITWDIRVNLFGLIKDTSVNNGSFKITVNRQEYTYHVADWHKWYEHGLRTSRIRVRYDESQLDMVQVYEIDAEKPENDRFLCIAELYSKPNVARVERTKEDWDKIHSRMDEIKAYDRQLAEEKLAYEEILSENGIDSHIIRGVSQQRHKEAITSESANQYAAYYGLKMPLEAEEDLVPVASAKKLNDLKWQEAQRLMKEMNEDN